MNSFLKKNFSSYQRPFVEQPNLIEIQTQSYNWLLTVGLKNF